jgi:hypothetical protein
VCRPPPPPFPIAPCQCPSRSVLQPAHRPRCTHGDERAGDGTAFKKKPRCARISGHKFPRKRRRRGRRRRAPGRTTETRQNRVASMSASATGRPTECLQLRARTTRERDFKKRENLQCNKRTRSIQARRWLQRLAGPAPVHRTALSHLAQLCMLFGRALAQRHVGDLRSGIPQANSTAQRGAEQERSIGETSQTRRVSETAATTNRPHTNEALCARVGEQEKKHSGCIF